MTTANASLYDHRPWLASAVSEAFPHLLDEMQLQYARFKLAVARVLKPATIYEVGVGWGVSAQAFLAGWPAKFYGIDNGQMGIDPNEAVLHHRLLPCVIADSLALPAFVHPDGPIDLIHIDGGHGIANKVSDIVKALESQPEWLLIDDVHDVMVASGTFAGLYKASANGLKMLYFENSHTGNLLVHVKRQAPEYRPLEIAV
jgi:predicted O-methyltransferase YrrM